MTLLIQCNKCKLLFWVEGYTTPNSFEEPGEIITDLESKDDLCLCLQNGEDYDLIDESYPFDDDYV